MPSPAMRGVVVEWSSSVSLWRGGSGRRRSHLRRRLVRFGSASVIVVGGACLVKAGVAQDRLRDGATVVSVLWSVVCPID
jgi:hypothetical protein